MTILFFKDTISFISNSIYINCILNLNLKSFKKEEEIMLL